jgi:hypothetical protein
MSTPAEIKAELNLMMGSRSDYIAARQYQHISWAEQELAYAIRFPELEAYATIPLVASQTSYLYPSDLFAIYSLIYPTLGRKLVNINIEVLDKIITLPSGAPARYARYGKMLYIDTSPTSDEAGNTLKLRYLSQIAEVDASSSAFTLPHPFHEAILLGSLYRAHRAFREYEQANEVKRDYLAFVRSRVIQFEEEDRLEDGFPLEVRLT